MRKILIALSILLLSAMQAAHAADPTGAAMPAAPIVFFDIAGPDADKLKAFYAGNFGWDIDAALGIKTPHLDGSLRQDPPEKVLYIGVPDIDAAMKKVAESGGEIVSPKIPIPSGVFVLFKDPAGNRMGLVQLKN
jgi:predicted enzyme related to lactoylglutathione lyase